jgi:hypothetical protein
MKRKLSLLVVVIFFNTIHLLHAQNDADALRYSMLNYGSTARSLGMGNSFGALGADFSTLAINPAGIGVYRRSEITLSPLFLNRSTTGKYFGDTEKDNSFKFAFGNFGVVFAGENNNAKSFWKSWAFGVGYNKLNDFNSRSIATGNNPNNSLIDNYIEQLEGTSPATISSDFPYDVNLAWQTYLIDTVTQNDQLYYFNNAIPFGGAQQRRTVETRGGQGEWDFSLGTNYNNKFYFGFTLGLTSLRYEEDVTWDERDNMDTIPFFKSYSLHQHLKTEGTGFNLKFGAIYRPMDAVRIGLAIHTPTFYSLTDNFSSNIRTDLENGSVDTYAGPEYIPYSYDLTTPFRTIGSLAFIFGKQGAINFDYEFIDYGMGRMDYQENDSQSKEYFSIVNKAIRLKYTGSHNLRLGAEYVYDNVRFRVGGQYSTSPFKNDQRENAETDLSMKGLSAGIGIREEHFLIDFGYSYSQRGTLLLPYTLKNQTGESITYTQYDNRFMFTVGTKF